MKIGWQQTKLFQKLSGLLFLAHPVYDQISAPIIRQTRKGTTVNTDTLAHLFWPTHQVFNDTRQLLLEDETFKPPAFRSTILKHDVYTMHQLLLLQISDRSIIKQKEDYLQRMQKY